MSRLHLKKMGNDSVFAPYAGGGANAENAVFFFFFLFYRSTFLSEMHGHIFALF